MAASALITTSTNSSALSDDIIRLIMLELSYPTIYKLHLEGNTIYTKYLLDEGKRIITLLDDWIHPDSGYYPITEDFDFGNLELVIKHIWNMLICLSSVSHPDAPDYMLGEAHNACKFITMECECPNTYDDMCADMWKFIILKYLDSEYDSSMEWLGGYRKWKYICGAIHDYPEIHELDTLPKQKYALSILIMTYLENKDEIMHLYENEYEKIDTNEKYYRVLTSLIAVVSKNGHLGAEMVSKQFVKNTFYFMYE